MLAVDSLSKTHPGADRPVLDGVSFQLGPEDTLAVIGPSGCGKSSLLYLLCGLSAPDSGTVTLDGSAVRRPTTDIAIILQDYGLFPWKTALQNVALGLKLRGVPRSHREAEGRTLLGRMGLQGRENSYPGELSGGEQQRVAIARAYALEPRVLLMDEPFSSLDAITREKLQGKLLESWREQRVPFVLVTHSVEEAAFLGRRIMVLAGRPARVERVIENPSAGDVAYRDSSEYFDRVREIRKTMEALW